MSTTVYEFAARLSRRHAGKGPSELTAADTLLLADAINRAVNDLFRLLPVHYRTREVPFTATPRTVTLGMAAGSDTLTSGAFLETEIGCSVLFTSGGDAAWHQVAATNRLRLPWAGATGTATATVYADAAQGPGGRIERILSDPTLVMTEGYRRRLALMIDADREAWLANAPRIGSPEFYQLQPAGSVDGGGAPVAWLRLWPLPAVPVRLVALCEIWPARVRANQLTDGASSLPVPDDAVEDALDLAGEHLAAMPGFQSVSLTTARDSATMARRRILARMPATHPTRNRVMTPYGF